MRNSSGAPMGTGSLYAEHLALGATFGEGRVPARYGAEPDVGDLAKALGEGALLCDVSDAAMLLLSGEPAQNFCEAAFAARRLRMGECAFEAVLTGDGSVASLPLLARTGIGEYVCADLSQRAEVLEGWLSFLSAVEQDGTAPFAGLELEDVSGSHAALLLWGQGAPEVLGDYVVGGAQALPARGCVASCQLDRLPCIVCHLELGERPAFAILVPPVHAAVLWRSLLSFAQVEPVGHAALRSLLHDALPWTSALATTEPLRMRADELASHGLARSSADFVGARGLYGNEGFRADAATHAQAEPMAQGGRAR